METTAPTGLVDIDATAFADAFALKSVAVRHSLADHPLYVERVLAVIGVNKRMRRLRLSPRPIGASEPVDRAKAAVVRSPTKLPGKLRA
jgi:hypothetical protein